jgi:hypothetical protein
MHVEALCDRHTPHLIQTLNWGQNNIVARSLYIFSAITGHRALFATWSPWMDNTGHQSHHMGHSIRMGSRRLCRPTHINRGSINCRRCQMTVCTFTTLIMKNLPRPCCRHEHRHGQIGDDSRKALSMLSIGEREVAAIHVDHAVSRSVASRTSADL